MSCVALQFGLLMPFWFKIIPKFMGCSSVWVTHTLLGQNNTKKTWVALQCGLLKLFWDKLLPKGCGLLFSAGYSCQNTHLCKNIEPTLMTGLLGLLMGCSVTLQRDPPKNIWGLGPHPLYGTQDPCLGCFGGHGGSWHP